jgi:hypothetical protein
MDLGRRAFLTRAHLREFQNTISASARIPQPVIAAGLHALLRSRSTQIQAVARFQRVFAFVSSSHPIAVTTAMHDIAFGLALDALCTTDVTTSATFMLCPDSDPVMQATFRPPPASRISIVLDSARAGPTVDCIYNYAFFRQHTTHRFI